MSMLSLLAPWYTFLISWLPKTTGAPLSYPQSVTQNLARIQPILRIPTSTPTHPMIQIKDLVNKAPSTPTQCEMSQLNGLIGNPSFSHTFISIIEILKPTSNNASNGTKFKYIGATGSKPVLAHPLGSVPLLEKYPLLGWMFLSPSWL